MYYIGQYYTGNISCSSLRIIKCNKITKASHVVDASVFSIFGFMYLVGLVVNFYFCKLRRSCENFCKVSNEKDFIERRDFV